nr:glycosyltransferase [uncultured Niameybacter sp.]
MKICILSIVNIKHMSAASLYLDYFRDRGIKFDIIYIDKYLKPERIDAENIYRYELKIERNWNKLKKVSRYYTFRKYAKKILDENKYDLVITWGTETAFLFFDYLIFRLKNKYIINIRDYANLNNKIKYKTLDMLIANSAFTTISSKGFKSFLPNREYINIHSINKGILNKVNKRQDLRKEGQPIRICFLGYVRFYDNDKKLIDALGNDNRFILQYFGVGSDVLEDYAKGKGINNIEFMSSFDVEETSQLLEQADIINNLYGYNNIALDTAVSIKYYYTVSLKIPILVYENTYMEKVSENIGFVFDDNYIDLGDRIYQWYSNLDTEDFKMCCDKKLQQIENENRVFFNKLKDVFGE